jgi:hypothetical protein
MIASARRTALFATTGFAVVLAVACASGARSGSTTHLQMQVHYEAAGQIQAAMVAGDLAAAREGARILADNPTDLGPAGQEHADDLAALVRTIRTARTFGEAADATGLMAATCGDCHDAMGRGSTFSSADPPQDLGFTGHMIAHSWAADRMWEGLLSHSTEKWIAGVDVFGADEPLHGGGLTPASDAFARRLHQLAAEARDVTDPHDRGRLYGQMLRQCSGCHAENGMGWDVLR